MSGPHAFLDESKRSGYAVVVAVVASGNLADTRRSLRQMLLPGQSALHFKDENDGRRRQLLDKMSRLPVRASVYRRAGGNAVDSRRACLEAAVEDLVAQGAARLILELADGDLAADKRTLYAAHQKHQAGFTYAHERAPAEPGLWVADAIAWAWLRGGPWRQRTAGLVIQQRDV